jgi:hypothetical protein
MNRAMTETKNNSLDPTDESFGYWHQKLSESPPLLNLPTDKSRRSTINFITASQSIYLSENSLQALGQDRKVALFVTLLAAFKVWMSGYPDRLES